MRKLAALTLSSVLLACSGGSGGGGEGGGPVAPAIVSGPQDRTVTEGQTATFSVTATGTAPLAYQWRKGATDIAGASSASYTTPATVLADSGWTYAVVVTNAAGSVTSAPATLTVNAAPVPPSITTQPAGQSVAVGLTATFTVVAAGTPPLSYQWKKGAADVAGATASSYTTPPAELADDGSSFTVTVSNVAGSVTSVPAILTVGEPGSAIALVTGMPVSSPRVAISADGSAIAVWVQGAPPSQAWSARYAPALQAWGELTRLDAGGGASAPLVAMDASGNAWAAWTEGSDILARRYDGGTTSWSDAGSVLGGAVAGALGMSPSGDVTLLLLRKPAGNSTFHAHAIRRPAAETSWPLPEILEAVNDDLFDSVSFGIAVNSAGDVLAHWRKQSALSGFNASAYLDAGTGTWGARVTHGGGTGGTKPIVGEALDESGNAYLRGGLGLERRDAVSGTWAAVSGFVDTLAGDLDVFDDGDVLLVNWDDVATGSLTALRWDAAGTAWGAPLELSPNNAQGVLVRTGASGDAVVAWTRVSPPQRFVRVAIYRASAVAWLPNDYLSRTVGGLPAVADSELGDLAMNASGEIAAVGVEGNGTGVWANWLPY